MVVKRYKIRFYILLEPEVPRHLKPLHTNVFV